MIQLRSLAYLLIILIAAGFFGCTHSIVAERYPVDEKMIPEFTSENPIQLTNDQNDQSAVRLGTNMGHKFEGNLQQFTEIAIETLEGELITKKITVEPSADKELKLAVTKVYFESKWSGFWCDATIQVETGDGYKEEVDGHDSNAWILFPCIHGALNHAVVAVLNDDNVIDYLKR